MDTADVVTACIAGAALALSIVGLILQWVMWSRSGAVLVAEASLGFLTAGPVTKVLTVSALNKGRGSAQVTSWWLEPVGAPPESMHWYLAHLHVVGSSDLPVVIDGEQGVQWFVPRDVVEDSCRELKVTHVRPHLGLGSGRKVAGKPLRVL
ncbi:hypothetical protein OG801_05835 [Nocardioides sp. NBC_00163]|uniref:hypothetical protein n=1 Tax=Nocardioides sp. NBC_00163 TaxID=2975999 RepID=UPI00325123B0